MADIVMTQVPGTTHHYTALIPVDPAALEPTIDLAHYLDGNGDTQDIPEAIQEDQHVEDTIEAEFEAQSTSVTSCKFLAGSYVKTPAAHTIALSITTSAAVVEADAIAIKFEFLHSLGR
jgi:hypothetical protein